MTTKTYTFHLSGTHCSSCKILIEDVLKREPTVKMVSVNLGEKTLALETESDLSKEALALSLSKKIEPHGYHITVDRENISATKDSSLWQALPLGLFLLLVFFLIQKSGLLNVGFGGTVTPATSFIVGLIASVSSCLAVVGGLVLSLSATVSQDAESDIWPMTLFHLGRILSFAVFGGLLGALGGVIGISLSVGSILGLVASLIMIALGLNLIGFFKRFTFTLPGNIFTFFRKVEHETLAPLLVGIGTFFLPCGFTQSMQVAALSSGSFFSGLSIMLFFALGTLPMLALLSFGSASFAHSKHAILFLKSAGIFVIGLGVFAFLAGLAGLGLITPLFNI